MSKLYNDVLSQFDSVAAAIVSVPFTFACWIYVDDIAPGSDMAIMSIGDPAVLQHWHQLFFDDSDDRIGASSRAGGSALAAVSPTNSILINKWHHACGVWVATDDRRVYLDGVRGTDQGSTIDPLNLDKTGLGSIMNSTSAAPFSGRIYDAGAWDIALNDAEAKRLANGAHPDEIKRGFLTGYWELKKPGDFVIDRSGNGNHLLPTNGPIAVASDPPLLLRTEVFGTRNLEIDISTVAAVGGDIDTAAKRRCVWGAGLPWMRILPIPDGTIAAADRASLRTYCGFAQDIAPPISELFPPFKRHVDARLRM